MSAPLHLQYGLHRVLNRVRANLASLGFPGTASLLPVHAVIALLLATLQFCDPNGQAWSPPLAGIVQAIYNHRLEICLILVAVEAVVTVIQLLLGWLHPIHAANAKSVLNLLVDGVFDQQLAGQHRYRATLFQIRGWQWLTGKWAGIACRSGEHYEASNTVFAIDPMRPERSTGWVGRCFEAQGQVVLTETPLSVDTPEDYLRVGRLTADEHRNLNVRNACLLYAVGIRRNGRLWGILVLDTTDPSRVQTTAQSRRKLRDALEHWAYVLTLTIR